MSVVKRIIKNNIEYVKVDELLAKEYEQAGYGGIQLTKTPLGAQINLFAMRPGRVIGKRGRAIKAASEKLEKQLGLPNPQITVIEVEVPELNPQIMASRIANALERGVHFRRSIFWSLRRIMDSGALGCEIVLKGPLRSARSRFEKVVEGYVPKSGDPALRNVKSATLHVKMKRGTLGVTVKIVAPDAKFPDKVSLEGLPDIEYQLPMEEPVVAPTPEAVEVPESTEAVEEPVAEDVTVEEIVEVEATEEPVVEEAVADEVIVEEAVEAEVTVEETITEEVAEPVITEEAAAEVEPAVEEPVAEEPVVEEAVADEDIVEEVVEAEVIAEAAEPEAIAEPAVEEIAEVEETPEEPVTEEVAEPVITEEAATEEAPEATTEEPAQEPELVSEPEPEPETEVVEEAAKPEIKPKPEAEKAEEAPKEPETEEETE
jgi:small subunit ribosomal protein S3